MRRIENVLGLERVCPFLWGDDSPEARHSAVQWMYANHAALAYSGYLRQGRGVLAGPFATTAHGALLDCVSLKEALFETGEMWTASVSYLPVGQKEFGATIHAPETRRLLMPALDRYNPEVEVPILLMRNGAPHAFLPAFRSDVFSPRYLYENSYGRESAGKILPPRPERFQHSNRPWESEKFKPTFVSLSLR